MNNRECMGKEINKFEMIFPAKSCNEKIARAVVSILAVQIDPTVSEMSDLVTAVSEAVTNCVIHGYAGYDKEEHNCIIKMECFLYERAVEAIITDYGRGIEDIEKAKTPLYTSLPDMERSGLGFTIMESFCDDFSVESEVGKGTVIKLLKIFGGEDLCENTTTPL